MPLEMGSWSQVLYLRYTHRYASFIWTREARAEPGPPFLSKCNDAWTWKFFLVEYMLNCSLQCTKRICRNTSSPVSHFPVLQLYRHLLAQQPIFMHHMAGYVNFLFPFLLWVPSSLLSCQSLSFIRSALFLLEAQRRMDKTIPTRGIYRIALLRRKHVTAAAKSIIAAQPHRKSTVHSTLEFLITCSSSDSFVVQIECTMDTDFKNLDLITCHKLVNWALHCIEVVKCPDERWNWYSKPFWSKFRTTLRRFSEIPFGSSKAGHMGSSNMQCKTSPTYRKLRTLIPFEIVFLDMLQNDLNDGLNAL